MHVQSHACQIFNSWSSSVLFLTSFQLLHVREASKNKCGFEIAAFCNNDYFSTHMVYGLRRVDENFNLKQVFIPWPTMWINACYGNPTIWLNTSNLILAQNYSCIVLPRCIFYWSNTIQGWRTVGGKSCSGWIISATLISRCVQFADAQARPPKTVLSFLAAQEVTMSLSLFVRLSVGSTKFKKI